MRVMAIVVLSLATALPTAALAKGRPMRHVSCCVEVSLPEVAPEPRCLVVNFTLHRRLHVGRRLFCRLAGGQPVVRGACTCA
jgi:hypothetical protein